MIVRAGLLALALTVTVWLFLRHIETINATHETRTSELLTRIQHPEIARPEIDTESYEPAAPVYDDDLDLVGTIRAEVTE